MDLSSGEFEGAVVWLFSPEGGEPSYRAAVSLEEACRESAIPCERVDASELSRLLVKQKVSARALGITLSLLSSGLSRHGVLLIVHGSRNPADAITWWRHKPGRLLNVCACHETPITMHGPYMPLHVDGVEADMETSPFVDVEPLLEELRRRKWVPGGGEAGRSVEDEALIRKRLEDLGYL